MQENRERRRHSKCRDKEGSLLYRLRCQWTSDDSATVLGICVSLLTVLAGTIAYIIFVVALFRLAVVLAHIRPCSERGSPYTDLWHPPDFIHQRANLSTTAGCSKCSPVTLEVEEP